VSDAATALLDRLVGHFRQREGRQGTIALHEPWFRGHEWDYVKDCLDTGWVSSVGAYVDRFEAMVAEACGTRFAIAAVNGTAATHVLLHALGIGPGDLVVVPALSFVATANAVAHCGAVPAFIDIDPATLGMSPAALRDFLAGECEWGGGLLRHRASGGRVAVVMPVHIFGHPCDMDGLNAVAAEYGLPLIEDAAEALGSRFRGRPCGGLGRAAMVSFNGNKLVTTGGGGMVVTDDEALARRIKHLSTTARVGKGWVFDHDEVGFNYRLPNLNAALGCAQMEALADTVARKRGLAQLYRELAEGIGGLSVFAEQPWAEGNYWLNAVIFEAPRKRDAFLDASNAVGLQTRPCWRLLCDLPMYRDAPRGAGGLEAARRVESRLVCLPSSAFLHPGPVAEVRS